MEAVARLPARPRLAAAARERLPAVIAWALPFVLVLYLALEGGGYDAIVRSQVGIALWWVVLAGVVVGALPASRIGRRGWVGIGLLAAFAAWTSLGIGGSESSERSVAELGRVAMYLGVLVLALGFRRPGMARHAVNGLSAAIAVVAGVAVLSRLQPEWFPANETASFLPGAQSRLSHPLNYWNALAALMALGLPLVLSVATSARTILGQALAAAALPVLSLCAFLTYSRGGALAAVVGLLVYVALVPGRVPKLATLLVAAAGSALLIAGVGQRPALEDGLLTATARDQGDGLLAMVAVVCVGTALVQAGIALAVRHGTPRAWLRIPRPRQAAVVAGAVTVLAAGALAVGSADEIADRWTAFKTPSLELPRQEATSSVRFGSGSGNGRYQYWQAALDASASRPLLGIGAGTYEYWWSRNAPHRSFIRDAHSLYLETLAELGIPGLAFLAAFILWILGVGVRRTVREGSGSLAAATAGCAAFAVSASVDWVWEVAVLPVAFLLLAAVLLGSDSGGNDATRPRLGVRLGLVGLAVAALVAIGLPLAGTSALRDSQAAARAQRIGPALADARTAARVQPYAAGPRLQEALVLELDGDLGGAEKAVRAATANEPTNWRTWLVRSRIEARRGHVGPSVRAYRKAAGLNPRSKLFAR